MSGKYITTVESLSPLEIKNTLAFHRNNRNKIKFLGYLLNVKMLYSIRENAGAQLCTPKIAEGLGLSTQTIGNYIRELVRLKWLRITDPRYGKGKRSKCYSCTNFFIRRMHVQRNPTAHAVKGLKQARLIERRKRAWVKQEETFLEFENEVIHTETMEPTAKQRQKAFKAYAKVSKLYIGKPWDMLRDLDHFIKKGRSMNKTHRELFFQANKSMYAHIGIKKNFTRAMFLGEGCYRKQGMFTGPKRSFEALLARG